MNKLVQLHELIGNEAGASNKARSDVRQVGERLGFSTVGVKTIWGKGTIKLFNKLAYLSYLKKALQSIDTGSILLIQVPFLNLANESHRLIKEYCQKNSIKVICIIHDLNDIRSNKPAETFGEFYGLLKASDAVISHNYRMTDYLVNNGIEKKRIINLLIFDYLLDKEKEKAGFSKALIIAGNLDPGKVGYIRHLREVPGVVFELYGPNFDERCNGDNIKYKGVVKSNELPYLLSEGFGLVWDGTSINTCDGNYGNYLKYNNPHKLSLYLSAGIPVVIWSKAAEADYVRTNQIGITVDSLADLQDVLNTITKEKYELFLNNVIKIRKQIVSGGYAAHALEEALKIAKT